MRCLLYWIFDLRHILYMICGIFLVFVILPVVYLVFDILFATYLIFDLRRIWYLICAVKSFQALLSSWPPTPELNLYWYLFSMCISFVFQCVFVFICAFVFANILEANTFSGGRPQDFWLWWTFPEIGSFRPNLMSAAEEFIKYHILENVALIYFQMIAIGSSFFLQIKLIILENIARW